MKIISAGEKLTSDAEKKLSFLFNANVIPNDYLDFLKRCNGGYVRDTVLFISNDEGETLISSFYGQDHGQNYGALTEMSIQYKDRIPHNLLPIAGDQLGNQICIGVEAPILGQIFFWDHELESIDGNNAVTYLAEDFKNFIESLYEDVSIDPIDQLIKNEDIDGLNELILKGYDLNKKDENDCTLLEKAVIKNKINIVSFLIEKGANIRGALDIAVDNYEFFPSEFEEMVEYLKEIEKKHDI